MAAIIRPAHGSDIPYLYEICLKTGNAGQDATSLFYDPLLVGQYYAAPYFFHDPGLCFIAEFEDIPHGYIVAASDTGAFNQWMEQVWLPPLRCRYPKRSRIKHLKTALDPSIVSVLHQPLSAPPPSYPAHLHIDLLPAIQGQGAGRLLMRTLFDALSRRGCPGAHLGVSKSNTGAIAFYRKMGFVVLQENEHGLTMGKLTSPVSS
jgi:ribosomal protein S18 acetylase RimI-like enzyme